MCHFSTFRSEAFLAANAAGRAIGFNLLNAHCSLEGHKKVNPQCEAAPEELIHITFFRMAFVCQQAYNHFSRTSCLLADFGSISQHA